jgi:hypothetical protein
MFLYWVKDYQFQMDKMYHAHHGACLLGLVLSFSALQTARGWVIAKIFSGRWAASR